MHAFALLECDQMEMGSVVPVYGADRFLRSLAVEKLIGLLHPGGETDFAATTFDGDKAQWNDVSDELSTISLFSTGSRIVVVQEADAFVKKYRDKLEKLVCETAADRCLVLCVGTWAANTKLFKLCAKHSCQIDVNAPMNSRGRSKSRDDKQIIQWIVSRGEAEHGVELAQSGAKQMLELVDDDFGRIDNELAKVSLLCHGMKNKKVSAEQIVEIVGGWKAQSIWQAVDFATDGQLDDALQLLHRLLQAGEHPLSLYGQLSWSLRRFGATYDIFMRAKRRGESISVQKALKEGGFRSWGSELELAEKRMKTIGRNKISQIYKWLLKTDLALKGTHSHENRARFALEKLFILLATPSPTKPSAPKPSAVSVKA